MFSIGSNLSDLRGGSITLGSQDVTVDVEVAVEVEVGVEVVVVKVELHL